MTRFVFLIALLLLSAQAACSDSVFKPFLRFLSRPSYTPTYPGTLFYDGTTFVQITSFGKSAIPTSPGGGGVTDPLILNAVQADSFTNKAGTGPPNFSNGLLSAGETVLSSTTGLTINTDQSASGVKTWTVVQKFDAGLQSYGETVLSSTTGMTLATAQSASGTKTWTTIQTFNAGLQSAGANDFVIQPASGRSILLKNDVGSNYIVITPSELQFTNGFASQANSSVLGNLNVQQSGAGAEIGLTLSNTNAANTGAVVQIQHANSASPTLSMYGFYQTSELSADPALASGFGRWYSKTDGKPYFINDAGTVYDLTATSGGTYAPAVPADWAAPAPTTVAQALDRLSAALATHLGVPIP